MPRADFVASIMARLGLDISDYQNKLEKAKQMVGSLPTMAGGLLSSADDKLLEERIKNIKRSADVYDQMAKSYRDMSGQARSAANREQAEAEAKLRDAEAQLAKVRQETAGALAEKSKSATIKAIEREVREAERQLRNAQTQAEKASKSYTSSRNTSAASSERVMATQVNLANAQAREQQTRSLIETTKAAIVAKNAAISEAEAQAKTVSGAAKLNLLYKQLEALKSRLAVQETTLQDRARLTAKALEAQVKAQENVAKAARNAMAASEAFTLSNRGVQRAEGRLSTARLALETARNADASKYATASTNAEVEGNRRVLAAVRAVEAAKNDVAKAQDRVNNAVNREAALEQRAAKAAQQAETARARAAAVAAKAGDSLRNMKVGDLGLGTAIISAGTLYASLQSIESALAALIKPGFEFAQTMEQARIGIAATLRSMTKIDGDPINMSQALEAADSLIDRLNMVSVLTGGTRMGDVVRTYQGLLGPGLGAGLDAKQLIEYTQTGINAAKAMQLPTNQFIQELRDLVQGGISAQSSTIASSLGLRDSDIKAAKASAEGLFTFLMQRMQGYNEMAGRTFDTIHGKIGLLEGAVERASSKFSEAFAPEIKSALDLVTSLFATLDRETATFTVNPAIMEFIDKLHMKYMELLDLFGDFDVDGTFYPSTETLAKLESLKKLASDLADKFLGALGWLIEMEPVLEAIGRAVVTVAEEVMSIIGFMGDILLLLKDHTDAVETIFEWLMRIVVIPGMLLSGLGLVIQAFTFMLSPIGKCIKLLWRMVKAVRAIGVAAAIARLGIVGMTIAASAAVGVVGAAGGKTLAEGSGLEGFKENLSQMASALGETIGNAIDAVTGSDDGDSDEEGFLARMEQRQKELRAAWEQRMANFGLGIGKGNDELVSQLKADPKKDTKAEEKANKERLRELQRGLKEALEAEKTALEDIKQNIQSQMKKLDTIWKQGLMSAEEYYTTKAELEKKQAQAEYDSLARELELIKQTEYEQEAVKNREILKVQREMMKAASKLGEAVDSFEEVNRFARETAILQRNAQATVKAQTAQGNTAANPVQLAVGDGNSLIKQIQAFLSSDYVDSVPLGLTAEQVKQFVAQAVEKGVDVRLALAMASAESGGNQNETSDAGAIGIMQLMPDTAASLGVNPYDAAENIAGGVQYLAQQLQTFDGDIQKAVAAYNAGPQAVKYYGGVPPYGETQAYVERVLDRYKVLSDFGIDDSRAIQVASAQTQLQEASENAAQGLYKLYTRSTELEGEGVTWVRQVASVDVENLTARAKFMLNNMAAFFKELTGKPLTITSGYRGNGEHFGDAIDYRGTVDPYDIDSYDLLTDPKIQAAMTDYIQSFLKGGNADEYRDTTYGGWHNHADASGRNWTNSVHGWGPAEYGGVDVNMAANAVASQSVQNAAETLAQQQAAALLEQSDKAFTEALLQEAESWKGTPYMYGGTDRNGVDCSAFVQNVFKARGMELARSADAQAKQYMDSGAFRKDIENIRAGDLVFFKGHDTGNYGIGHVGLYIGNGKFLDSSTTGVPLGEDTLSRRSDFVGYGDTRALFRPELKSAYSTALTEAGVEAKEAIKKQYEDLLEKIAEALDLVGEGAEIKKLIEQRKYDELINQYNLSYDSFRKMVESGKVQDLDGSLDKIWQQAGTAIEWLHNQKMFDIDFKDIEAKQELKLKELAATAERAADNIGIFVQSLDGVLSDANINIVDATKEVKRYGKHFFFNKGTGVLSEMRDMLNRLSQMGTEAELKGIIESWWQVQDGIKKGMDAYSDAVQKMREATSDFYDYRDQKLANNAAYTDLQRSEREENLKRGRAAAELRIDTAALNTWKNLVADINAEIAVLIRQYEELNKQNELTEADKEKLDFINARIQDLGKTIQYINGQKILPLERAIELNKQLAYEPTLLEEVGRVASQAIENGLVTFLTDGINNAESLNDALRELAVGILKELQSYFAKNLVEGMMPGINKMLGIKSPEDMQEKMLGENGAQLDANTQALQANTQALMTQQTAQPAAATQQSLKYPVTSTFQAGSGISGNWAAQTDPYTFNPANYQLSLGRANNMQSTLQQQQPYTFNAENYNLLNSFASQFQSAQQQLAQAFGQVGQEGTQVSDAFMQIDQAAGQVAPALDGMQQGISTAQSAIDQSFSSVESQLQAALNGLVSAINQAATRIRTAISALPIGGGAGGGFATGGYISGPGTSTSDSIPARLSNGEFIMRANAVRQYGRNMMERINNGTWGNVSYRVPGFADGGLVGTMGAESTARGMSQFAGQIGTNVSTTNKMNIALVRDENEAMSHFMRSGPGQRIMLDFARKNAAVVSRFSGR